jgi:dTDP-4-amino-4,6-dideoxygalactose transaminase
VETKNLFEYRFEKNIRLLSKKFKVLFMKTEGQLIIPQTSPYANYLTHKIEIDKAIMTVLESGRYVLGSQTKYFEEEFANYIGVNNAVAVSSGTDALSLALRACNIGPGDAVISVSHTAVATIAAIENVGAVPVLIDIDPRTFTMDPNFLEEAIRKIKKQAINNKILLKAIIPVHLYGHPADMQSIMNIAKEYDLFVIEDCAQSNGAIFKGKKTGALGHLAAFSFYPTKNLGALGDGGMVVTDNDNLYDKLKLLRQYGWHQQYISTIKGTNSRLDEIQAAILRVKLNYLDKENKRRCEVAKNYEENLSNTPLILPQCLPGNKHVYHQYVVRTSKRDLLKAHLQNRGIGSLIHYPLPVHLQPAYLNIYQVHNKLPITEQVASEILSLPIFPELSDEEIKSIIESIQVWINSETRNK